MTPLLLIRNLSAAPIALKRLERFEDPNTQQSRPGVFSFSAKNHTSAAPSAPKLGEHAQTFNHQDLDVELAPWESYTLRSPDPSPTTQNTNTSLTARITIELPGGERHRIDTNPTYTQKASQACTPLTPNPSITYRAIYHPARPTPHLTLHTNHLVNYSEWMSTLPSILPLSALSIPGTHNSHTVYRALPSVRCQVVSVKSQLENGIRFLDIRVQPLHATDVSKKDLYLVHGAFPVSLTGPKYLEPVLKVCYEFLEENPSEAILVSLKREGVGSSTDELLSQILEKHYITPNRDRWYVGSSLPYLGDVRGKLVLVRRYTKPDSIQASPEDAGYGLDATEWPDNCSHAMHGPFCVQDFCDVLQPSSITQKLQYSNEHMIRAAECTAFIPGVNTDKTNPVPAGPVYLNFLSGSNFFKMSCWPERIAKIVNRGMEEWICMGHHLENPASSPGEPGKDEEIGEAGIVRKAKNGDGGTGVVVMDCVGEGGDWDLVQMIVCMNTALKMKLAGTTM